MDQFKDKVRINRFQKLSHENTVWRNDNNVVARFNVVTTTPIGQGAGYIKDPIEIKPGEEVSLPSIYDPEIRKLDKRGIIVGGLCPWLTKVGDEDREIEQALDYKSVIESQELEKIAAKLQKEKHLEDAIKLVAKRTAEETVKKPGRPVKSKEE